MTIQEEINKGVLYRSAVSGLWYRDILAAGTVSEVKVDGVVFSNREEMSGELERVKAELNSTYEKFTTTRDQRRELEDAMESLKSRLPRNADGDVIFIGSTQYRHCRNGKIEELKVIGISGLLPDGDTTDGYTIGTKNRNCINTELHSTAESCRAAA